MDVFNKLIGTALSESNCHCIAYHDIRIVTTMNEYIAYEPLDHVHTKRLLFVKKLMTNKTMNVCGRGD